MARFKSQGVWTDGNGRRIDNATVSAYLAGTDTAASIYADSSGGSAVNSVTTDTSGLYEFWVDDTDYTQDQLFKITMSKTSFQPKTIDDIEIFKSNRLILEGSHNYFIDGRTSTRQVTVGAVRQAHTAGIAGTRAYHFDIRPNGMDDTAGVVIRHDLEGGANVIRPKGLNLSVDVTGATNCHYKAIEVAKVGDIGAGMQIDALDVRQGVNVIDQESGTVGAVDKAFKYDDSGASYTDVTTAFGSAGTDVTIFDEDDDYIYLGHASTFTTVEVILATVASSPGVKPTFEYSQGSSNWNAVSVSDDTNGFRENGTIFFEEPGDWATDTVNAVASKYWFRIKRTANSLSTVPTEDTIKVVSATTFGWDADGDVVVNNVTAGDLVVNNVTGARVIVSSNIPQLTIQELDAAAENQIWDFTTISGQLCLRAINDAYDSANNIFTVDRTGTTVDLFNILSTNLQHNGVPIGVSGTYSAIASDILNLDSTPVNHVAQYMRVGNTVTVSGLVIIDPTTTATATQFRLTLPIASDLNDNYQLGGTAAYNDSPTTGVDVFGIYASTTDDKALFIGTPTGVTSRNCHYTYTYRIL